MGHNFDPKNGDFQKLVEQLADQSQANNELKAKGMQQSATEANQAGTQYQQQVQQFQQAQPAQQFQQAQQLNQPQRNTFSKGQNQNKNQGANPRNKAQPQVLVNTKLRLAQYITSIIVSFTLANILTFLIVFGLKSLVNINLATHGIFSLWFLLVLAFIMYCFAHFKASNQKNMAQLLKNGQVAQNVNFKQQFKQDTIEQSKVFLAHLFAIIILLIVLFVVGTPFVIIGLGRLFSQNYIGSAFLLVLLLIAIPFLIMFFVRLHNKRKNQGNRS